MMPVVLASLALLVAACGSSGAAGPSVTTQAQQYAKHANLKVADLPSGWRSAGSSSSLSTTTSTLGSARSTEVNSVLGTLPATCRPLDQTFIAFLLNGAPHGALAQNLAAFASSTGGDATIDSTVVVFSTVHDADVAYGHYASPSFGTCLQGFLEGTLSKVAGLTGVSVTVGSAPAGAPTTGVEATGFTVDQTGTAPGSTQSRSVTDERVLRSGRAMAFLGVQSAAAAIPTPALGALDTAVTAVAARLVPTPG